VRGNQLVQKAEVKHEETGNKWRFKLINVIWLYITGILLGMDLFIVIFKPSGESIAGASFGLFSLLCLSLVFFFLSYKPSQS